MDIETVILIHEYLTEYFENADDPITPHGIKHHELLESAVARPFQTAGGRDCYTDIFEKSAALFHSMINNHPFHNGNKRTALLSTVVFLDSNYYWLDKCDDDEMYDFTRKVAAHEISDNREDEIQIIRDWFYNNSRKRKKGDQRLKFFDLRDILHKFDYELGDPSGKTVDIKKNGETITTILKKGMHGFEEYDQAYINELRKRLKLTDEYGIDSTRFYGQKGLSESMNEFMQMRSNVMKELAKI